MLSWIIAKPLTLSSAIPSSENLQVLASLARSGIGSGVIFQIVLNSSRVEASSLLGNFHYGVPLGSVLGSTIFSIHINRLSTACLLSVVFLYAEDTEIHSSSKDIDDALANLNQDLNRVSTWFNENSLIDNTISEAIRLQAHRTSCPRPSDLGNFVSLYNRSMYDEAGYPPGRHGNWNMPYVFGQKLILGA